MNHFLYDWSDQNLIVGLFTPVNESVWEHIKLLFFPMLIYSFIMIYKWKREYPCVTSAFFFGILAGTLLIPLIYYAYTSILGKNCFVLDISTFILSVIISFWISYKYTLSCRLKSFTLILCVSVCFLSICFFIFTYHAPNITIFLAPSVSTNK